MKTLYQRLSETYTQLRDLGPTLDSKNYHHFMEELCFHIAGEAPTSQEFGMWGSRAEGHSREAEYFCGG